jgi:flagellar basal-body rod modification protein FlgD
VPSIDSALSGLQAATATGSARQTPKNDLDKDAFLRLLAAQLRHQDPSNAQDMTDQMAQVSQMTIVEQLTNLNLKVQQLVDRTPSPPAPATP